MKSTLKRFSVDILVLFVAIGVLAALLVKHQEFFHDDAYITLRYARNFAETGLIQWNRGEWVEGYTSLLHVVLTGGFLRLGIDAIEAAQLVNVIAVLVLLVATGMSARAVLPGRDNWLPRGLTVLTVAGSTPVSVWVLGGLEAVVAAALLAAGLTALLCYLRKPRPWLLVAAAVAYSLAILTRLDTSVFIAGSGLGLLMINSSAWRARFLAAAIVVGVPAAVSFVQMGIRWQVYGELFPLTFYAKADLPLLDKLSSGADYIALGLIMVPTVGIAFLITGIVSRSAQLSVATKLLGIAVFLQLLYICWAGGDHMPWARMFVPIIAPCALLLLASVSDIGVQTRHIVVGSSALAALIVAIIGPSSVRDRAAQYGEIVGRHIDRTWPAGITVALNTAGSTPFIAGQGRTFIDMLGLNDPIIAKRKNVPILTQQQHWPGHTKGDGAYVLSRAPDRIIIGPAHGVDISAAWFLSGAEMASMPEFARCYQRMIETIPYLEDGGKLDGTLPDTFVFTYYRRVCS